VSEFIEAFRTAATAVLSENPVIRAEWLSNPVSLKVHASSDSGFEVRLVCESYGLYPYAGEWHGAPWDAAVWKPTALSRAVTEFLKAVLSRDSALQVRYANGKPFKWVLHHRFEGKRVSDETGLLYYNWFGRRTTRTFQNEWLSVAQPTVQGPTSPPSAGTRP